jgi:hypothetical protein
MNHSYYFEKIPNFHWLAPVNSEKINFVKYLVTKAQVCQFLQNPIEMNSGQLLQRNVMQNITKDT